jgi:hypothetical protein
MDMLNGQTFLIGCDDEKITKVNKQMLHYYWSNDSLMFKGLVVPWPKKK